MNAEYTRHAYRRSVWAELGRLLLDRYVATDGAAKAEIICEEVFRSAREVPEAVILEIADRLNAYASEEEREMHRFELRRNDPAPSGKSDKPTRTEKPDKPVAKKR